MTTKQHLLGSAISFGLITVLASAAAAEEITIATVNNGDMVRMHGLSPQ